MDFFENIWSILNNMLLSSEDDRVPTEQTVSPYNIHPMEFDITAKPPEEIPIIQLVPIEPSKNPPTIQNIINGLLESFSDDSKLTSGDSSHSSATGSITTMDIPEPGGHTLVKVVEDATGKTVEILHESVTEIPAVGNKIANGLSHALNATSDAVTKDSTENRPNYVNIYIVAALALIFLIALSAAGILWCKKNRIKAEKRNQYPVMAVVNNEYMDPHVLKNSDKLRSVP